MSGPRRILVVGSGAREHALAWRLARDAGVERVVAAPGNALMEDVADVHPAVNLAEPSAVVALARRARVDLVVVGPEAPLVGGLADRLAEAGIACFGPSAAAARIEGSKAFCRDVCQAAGVAIAEGRAFGAVNQALQFIEQLGVPVVVKADGLAAGKGVAICATRGEAERHLRDMLEHGRFGMAGRNVVVERLLAGREASVIALADGERLSVLPPARDHKRLAEGDRGPNTGGMGAYAPLPEIPSAVLERIVATVHRPVLAELARRGTPFRGALYAGLMLTADGPYVLEFNARLGDPESQAIVPLLGGSLASALMDAATGALADVPLPAVAASGVAITLAAAGYPDAPRAGDPIEGIAAAGAAGGLVFGAGVRRQSDGRLVSAGGRVLTVVGRGSDSGAAAEQAYAAASYISFAGMQLRRDIGPPRAVAGEAA